MIADNTPPLFPSHHPTPQFRHFLYTVRPLYINPCFNLSQLVHHCVISGTFDILEFSSTYILHALYIYTSVTVAAFILPSRPALPTPCHKK